MKRLIILENNLLILSDLQKKRIWTEGKMRRPIHMKKGQALNGVNPAADNY